MIQPNELRIWNYAYDPDNEITQISAKTFELLEDLSTYYLSPIPLTRDILLKCGFKEVAVYANVYSMGNIRIHADKYEKTNTVLFVLYCDDDTIFSKEVSSVHHLQNLYFALNDIELDIKL